MDNRRQWAGAFAGIALVSILAAVPARAAPVPVCKRTVTANVVALNQALWLNRLGARQPGGMMFALQRDVIPTEGTELLPGKVQLRDGKRPRPLVLRANVGDCLRIEFTNLLDLVNPDLAQTSTLRAGVSVLGMPLVSTTSDDGSFVGSNPNSLIPPGAPRSHPLTPNRYTIAYTFRAEHEGGYLLFSPGANFDLGLASNGKDGNDGAFSSLTAGQLTAGLFGAVNVEPEGSEWYRSQVTHDELLLATRQNSRSGNPEIRYDAVYPKSDVRPLGRWAVPEGTPVLRMLDDKNQIVHSDLTAVITGPKAGPLAVKYPNNPALPNREQPFREFTTIYHEMLNSTPAFDDMDPSKQKEDESIALANTLAGGGDNFSINYGTGGISAEIWANRMKLGPAAKCPECKFEEFFLSSWANGDPALLVDVPANDTKQKATRALFPDDPSNVYHSYLNDHVRFRVLHGGASIHHIHHLHAQQWLHSPDSDESQYLDSQAIGPGASYTLEMVYNGTGNRNRTVGDSIFHCHFYPHFAAGMWSLWRSHDVFEAGTELDAAGLPVATARALPDGEIVRGTPIPAVVPLPTLAMAPLPAPVKLVNNGTEVQVDAAKGNPGFPFFVPGLAGHRPPHPPMDFAELDGKLLDGGLPRHLVVGGTAKAVQTRLNFSKESVTLDARELPEKGTAVEQAAMDFHARGQHPTWTPEGKPARFLTNGHPPAQGAPFADPCFTDSGKPARMRRYRAANISMDVVLNKKGWHFPQQRMLALWEDVEKTLNGTKPPEPLFFRANSDECVEYWHTNLTPGYYELDDFQVKTPVDILGQHIHLVKFDVTSSDGAANGWNYEDGTFSPDEVRERIAAINKNGGLASGSGKRLLAPVPAPEVFGKEPSGKGQWLGAQTTVQRWYADSLLDNKGKDRTLRTVFTHDHFGPSTHQQAGLYAGLLVEPAGSTWRDPVTGLLMGTRPDGGPTRFQADIHTPVASDSYREFAIAFQDMQLAYKKGQRPDGSPGLSNPALALSAPKCPQKPDGSCRPLQAPYPDLISQAGSGVASVNYRNEPLPFRVAPPMSVTPGPETAALDQVVGAQQPDQTDLSNVFMSMKRADPELNRQPNKQPKEYPPLTPGMEPTDPYTPLLRAYAGDKVQLRVLVGAHDAVHNFNVHGVKWLYEPSEPNSGYRSSQAMGISEHFELEFQLPPGKGDYLYNPSAAVSNLQYGLWGLLRAYDQPQKADKEELKPLPSNPVPAQALAAVSVCPPSAPGRKLAVSAIAASQLPKKALVYYERNDVKIQDPNGLLYVLDEDLPKLQQGKPVEPLVLRANAGECIRVTLNNRLDPKSAVFQPVPPSKAFESVFGKIPLATSTQVGLHPQLVQYDVGKADGVNVGINPVQTVAAGESRTFEWYAGSVRKVGATLVGRPIEFGAINLFPSDPLRQHPHGLVGALIIEPQGATAIEDPDTRVSATIRKPDGTRFREFVVIVQEGVTGLLKSDGSSAGVQQALNYGTEPMTYRYGVQDAVLAGEAIPSDEDLSCALSDRLQKNAKQSAGEPMTPVLTAAAGQEVRFRMLHAGDAQVDGAVLTIQNHSWQEEPYQAGSTRIGPNPRSNTMISQMGHGPTNALNLVIPSAGGPDQRPGDYLVRSFVSFGFVYGSWGIFRVTPPGKDAVVITDNTQSSVSGVVTVNPSNGKRASTVSLYDTACAGPKPLAVAQVGPGGRWSATGTFPSLLCARSDQHGVGLWRPEADPACSTRPAPAVVAEGAAQSKVLPGAPAAKPVRGARLIRQLRLAHPSLDSETGPVGVPAP